MSDPLWWCATGWLVVLAATVVRLFWTTDPEFWRFIRFVVAISVAVFGGTWLTVWATGYLFAGG